MSILTQRLMEVKALHETGRVTFAQAVAAVFEDADPDSIQRQIAAIGKPRTSKPTRTSRTSKSRQVAKQAAAMAELVGRVNPRVVARIPSAGGFTAEVLSDGTTRYVDADEAL